VFDDLVRVVAFIGNDRLGRASAQQFDCRRVIADVAASDDEVQRQADLVDQQVNLGG